MLWRKLRRDLWLNKAAYISCLAVIVIGLMVYTSIAIVYENLESAKERFYSEQNFADGFVKLEGMPISQLKSLEKIDGIAQIEGRIVQDVRVYAPDRTESVYLRLVSVNTEKADGVNRVHVLEGTHLSSRIENILLDPAFAKANQIELGSGITAIIEGKKVDFTVNGHGQSPEFVYAMRSMQDIYPAPETFGIAYAPLDVMMKLFQGGSTFNDIVFTVRDGYTYEQVEEQIKPRLKKYGLQYIIPRKDQMSNVILTQELTQLESMVATVPVIFLGVAAMVLYIMLRRMVEQQRGQIGTLKAFGYTEREILFHYLSYGMVIGLIGGILGGLAGSALSFPMTQLYQQFFALPGLKSEFSMRYFFFGILLSLIFSIIAAYQGSKGLLRLQPAEAMRPPTPPKAKKIVIEHLPFVWSLLTVQGKMATRNMFRNKLRSVFILIGVAFSFSMIAVSVYLYSMGDVIFKDQFTKVQTYDVKIALVRPAYQQLLEKELWRTEGVKKVEAMLEVPVSLENQWLKKDVVMLGLANNSSLYRVLDSDGNEVTLKPHGIYLTQNLAQALDIGVGREVLLESPYLKEESLQVPVAGIITQNIGSNAFMDYSYMTELLGHGPIATSMLLNIPSEDIANLKKNYQESPIIGGIEDKGQTMRQITELIESYSFTSWILVFFAGICGFAIIYSSSIIALSERQRELASLRVLGMSSKEAFEVLSFEQWVISGIAMLVGIPLSFSMLEGLAQSIDSDIMSIPVYFEPITFVYAAIGTVISILIAQYTTYSRIRKLVLADVLKERD
ncbi:ABC transporter permease [Desulfuribacillus stibiiarsenatis]|uniref:ABC transporter permease n=1 Tax=Desulfuribacillus stibiiarsenatis TaxID=1390249 RepID=UPI0009F66CDC|nr:ABC transporter permease [Desulfuribacillus stibiiarsenatis]